MEERTVQITKLLVDTSIFIQANSDFMGLHSRLLPLFFSAASEKGIALLTHPILEAEIKKHIGDSSICKEYQKLVTQIEKCKDILELVGYDDSTLNKITTFDIKTKVFETFIDYYSEAIRLDYPNPEKIFEQYFEGIPPFSSEGKKKCEFPDAFVIEAIKKYLVKYPKEVIMLISKDDDWKKAFCNQKNVLFCDSIDVAIKIINEIKSVLSEEIILELFQSAYKEMIERVQLSVEGECYDIPDYNFVEDFEIDRVKVQSIDKNFVPLKITRSTLLLKTTATLSVDGHGTVLDEDRTIWDEEDKSYICITYANLSVVNGEAEVECEIELKFDFEVPTETVLVSQVKINNSFNIEVFNKNVELTPIDPEFDYRSDAMDALENYMWH